MPKRSVAAFLLAAVNIMVFAALLQALSDSSTSDQVSGVSERARLSPATSSPESSPAGEDAIAVDHNDHRPAPVESVEGNFTILFDEDTAPVIDVDFDDAVKAQAYMTANQGRITALLARQQSASTPVDVKVTFKQPIPWDEFVDLRDEVGFTPFAYTFAAFDSNDQKAIYYQRALPDPDVVEMIRIQTEIDSSQVLGVIVAEGSIRITPNALGALARDPRVLIADTVVVAAFDLLQQLGYNPPQRLDEMDVVIPSPFWELDWAPET